VAEPEIAVSRRVYELCEAISNEKPDEQLHNPLNALNLRDFIVAITFVAGLDREISWATGRPSKSIKLSNKELHELHTRAYVIFDEWPLNFFELLKRQSRSHVRLRPYDGKLDTALNKEFGCLYRSLYLDLPGTQFDFLRNAFTQFLTLRISSLSLPAPGTSSRSSSSESQKYISLVAARRTLKITNAALFELVTEGEIHCVIINGRRNPEFAVNKLDVERVVSELDESITPRDVARLGVAYEDIRAMTNQGQIKHQARRSSDGFHTPRFPPAAVKDFLTTSGRKT